MSDKINRSYKMAKKDSEFIRKYNQVSTDDVSFPIFADVVHKGAVAVGYYGYLIGRGDIDKINYINKK